MYRKILVLVDNRTVTQSAIDQAIALAQVHRADILFLCVVSPLEFPATHMLSLAEVPADAFRAKAEEEASRLLSSASGWAQRCGVRNHHAISFEVDGAHAAADTAVKRHCDLIVVGTEQQNAVVRLLNGSIVPGLLSAATVPVLVCRERPICTQRERDFKSPFSSNPLIFYEAGSRKDDEPND